AFEAFRYITLPAVRPTLIVVGILQVIIGLQVFDLLYTLTNGGPGRSTYVLIYAIYEKAFGDVSLGYASAITVVLFGLIVLCSFLLLVFQVRRRRVAATILDEEAELAAASARTSLRFNRLAPGIERALSEGRPATIEPPRRRLVRLPERVGRVGFGLFAALLLFFFVAPIAWIFIASLQTEDALKAMPPH